MTARTTFYGRDREIAEVAGSLESAIAGERQIVLLSGEPGIGKTTLATELARLAAAQEVAVVWGRAWESGGAPPLWPWIQLLRGILSHGAVPELRAEIPSACAIVEDLVGAIVASTDTELTIESRFVVFDAISQFVHSLGVRAPQVIILEDIHIADPSSLHLLNFISKARPDSRVLLLATFRHAEAQARPEIDDILAEIERDALRIHLEGLDPDACAQLVTSIGDRYTEADPVALRDMTGGNPLFLREIARGGARPEASGIRAAIRRHLEVAGPEVLEVLKVASVIGRSVELRLLVELADAAESDVRSALGRAASEGFVQLVQDRDEFTFSHDLVRRAVYESIPVAERGALHRRAAMLLEKIHSDSLDLFIALIAHHYSAAGESAAATDYLMRAAEAAFKTFAYESAVEHLEKALELVSQQDSELRSEILIMLGDALSRGIANARGRPFLLEAAALADSLGDPVRRARAAAIMAETTIPAVYARDDELIDEITAALSRLPHDAAALKVRLLTALVYFLNQPTEADSRREAREEAIRLATDMGDALLLAEALRGALAGSLYEIADPADAIALTDRLLMTIEPLRTATSVVTRLRVRELDATARRFRSTFLLESGDALAFEAETSRVLAAADELRQPRYVVAASCLENVKAMMRGRFAEVEERADEILQTMPDELNTLAIHVVQKSWALYELGRGVEMEDMLEALLVGMPNLLGPRIMLSLSRLQDARADEAFATVAPILADPGEIPKDSQWLSVVCAAALAVHDLNRPEASLDLDDMLSPFGGRHCLVSIGQPAAYLGPVDLYRGVIAVDRGLTDRAAELLGAAISQAETIGAPAWAARSRFELARLHAASAESNAARSLASETLDFVRSAQMPYLQSRLEQLLKEVPASSGVAGTRPVVLRRNADVWIIERGDVSFHVKHMRGFDHLVELLSSPGREFHAVELAGSGGAPPAKVMRGDELEVAGGNIAVLDERAREEYKRRIIDLQEDIDEADAQNDPERGARARAEMDFLVSELSKATGLGERARAFSEPAERARVAVTKSVRRVLDRIAEHDAPLARYLYRTVTTGTFCSYKPDPDDRNHPESLHILR